MIVLRFVFILCFIRLLAPRVRKPILYDPFSYYQTTRVYDIGAMPAPVLSLARVNCNIF